MLHELCHSLELEESHELNDFKEFIYTHFDIKEKYLLDYLKVMLKHGQIL